MQVIRQSSGHLLAASVEQAKINLSASSSVAIDLRETVPGVDARATKVQFETVIARELERLAIAVGATLAAAGQRGAAITTLFLTGGTSAVPAVKELLLQHLPRARAIEGDLFNSVGFGLALEAKRRFVQRKVVR